ncbi:MAG: hypothetical protein AB7E52_06830, partial [Bdellovibrionales bacterium]
MSVCSLLTSEDDVTLLASAWRDLQQRIGLAPFTDYDWAKVWWDTIGKSAGAELYVVACHEGDRLVGVIPFTVRITRGVRILRLLGHEAYYYRNFLIEDPAYVVPMWETVLESPIYDFANIKNVHAGTVEDAFFAARAFRMDQSRVFYCEHNGEKR